MDQTVRKFLIDQCVKGEPVYYEVIGNILNLNLDLDSDRGILSKTLGDISTFEFEKGRPLISSIAIYKQKNDHGYGFYDLCQDLKIGKAKALQDKLYGFTEMERSKTYWLDKSHYANFYELAHPVYDETNAPPFFKQTEIDFFKQWCDAPYDPENSDDVNAKNYLLDTVWAKTKFWSNEVVARLPGYETSNKRAWSKRGWNNGVQVSTFKPYTWARIFKKGDRYKDIFFTIGVDPGSDALIYKLDYFREADTQLSEAQKDLCEKHIPKNLMWNEIDIDDLPTLNWEKLIQFIVDFISANSQHYDQVERLVWGTQNPNVVFNNSLTHRDYPAGGLTAPPVFNPSFKGQKVDFIKKNIENKELGDAGEELVRDYEIKRLSEKGMAEFADRVRIAEDGEGYDVLSFDENGNEKYIEVKTTEGNEKTPFHLSINEYIFCERNTGKYCIYRLYNFNYETNHADYFIINEPLNTLIFVPTDYQVYLKKVK
jgi:hypothetical protein